MLMITNKKAGLLSCCSANRGSSIACKSEQQHRAPLSMYIVRLRARAIHTNEHLVLRCLGFTLNLLDSY